MDARIVVTQPDQAAQMPLGRRDQGRRLAFIEAVRAVLGDALEHRRLVDHEGDLGDDDLVGAALQLLDFPAGAQAKAAASRPVLGAAARDGSRRG